MYKIYRVVARSKESGKENVCYSGDRASIAVETFEDLKGRKAFVADFSIRLERMESIIIDEVR